MNKNVSIAHHGKVFTAEYEVANDVLTICLPDGSSKKIQLGDHKPESEAKVHLRTYIKKIDNKANQPDLFLTRCIHKNSQV